MADQYQKLVADPVTLPSPSPSLFAGGYPRQQRTIVIVTGQPALARGTLMGKVTASGKYIAHLPGASDGSEVAQGVLGVPTDAATADVTAFIYTSGDFNEALVLDGAGAAPTAAVKAALAALHIELKKVSS